MRCGPQVQDRSLGPDGAYVFREIVCPVAVVAAAGGGGDDDDEDGFESAEEEEDLGLRACKGAWFHITPGGAMMMMMINDGDDD